MNRKELIYLVLDLRLRADELLLPGVTGKAAFLENLDSVERFAGSYCVQDLVCDLIAEELHEAFSCLL